MGKLGEKTPLCFNIHIYSLAYMEEGGETTFYDYMCRDSSSARTVLGGCYCAQAISAIDAYSGLLYHNNKLTHTHLHKTVRAFQLSYM